MLSNILENHQGIYMEKRRGAKVNIAGKIYKLSEFTIEDKHCLGLVMWLGLSNIEKIKLVENRYVYVINEELFNRLEAVEVN